MPADNNITNGILEAFEGFLSQLSDEARAMVHDEIDRRVYAAIHAERSANLGIASAAMLEAGIKPEKVMNLLQKYWDVSRGKARDLAYVEGPARLMEEYWVDQGTPREDAHALANRLMRLLEKDPSLGSKPKDAQRKAAERALAEWEASTPKWRVVDRRDGKVLRP